MFFIGSKKYLGKQFGEYTIESSVGEGRYGECFIARSSHGTRVIIKRFKPHIFNKNREKNAYEAIMLSQLKHNKIPLFLGVINQKDFYAFVLEQKRGESIETMLFKQKHRFDDLEIFNIGLQLIEIMKHIHNNGMVHRDIRCANVIYDGCNVYLVDFGLARWFDAEKYFYDTDFSYFGDLLLYLIYSSQKIKWRLKNQPWYKELRLSCKQQVFIKRLLRIEFPYSSISDIEIDFIDAFEQEANANKKTVISED